MITFTPRSKEERESDGLIPEGTYDACVTKAEEQTSRTSGSAMIKLTLCVWDAEGRQRTVFDYLVFQTNSLWKVESFCEANGLLGKYDQGKFGAEDCEGKSFRVKLGIKKGSGEYGDQNAVKAYEPSGKPAAERPAPKAAQASTKTVEYKPIDEKDIPF